MGVRSGSQYRIIDNEGREHWVPVEQERRPRPARRQRSWFWRIVLLLAIVMGGGAAIASSMPVTQTTTEGPYVARTLNIPSTTTTIPTTTKPSGPAAIACQALGFR